MRRVVLAILFMLLPATAMAETANDAIIALRSLVKITANGTSYQVYASCLAEVKPEVDAYLKSDAAKQNKKLSQAIAKTLGLFEYADSFFKRIDESKNQISLGDDASPAEKKVVSEYFSRFPEDKQDVTAGGVLVERNGSKLRVNAALSKIFSRASAEYAKAAGMTN